MHANITLGQFLPFESSIHRLDPRTKILLMIVYIVVIFVVQTIWGFILPTVLLFLLFALAHMPASYFFSSLKPMRWLLVFMFVINLFATRGDTVLWSWWILRMTKEAQIGRAHV